MVRLSSKMTQKKLMFCVSAFNKIKEPEMSNVTETVERIKRSGNNPVRVTKMVKDNGDLYQIEMKEGKGWTVIADSLSHTDANDIVKRSTSRTICG